AQAGVVDGQSRQVRAQGEAVVGGVVVGGAVEIADLHRHHRQIVQAVEVGPRIEGAGVVDLELAEGAGRAVDVVEVLQPHADHLPDAGVGGGGEGIALGNVGLGGGEQFEAASDVALIHQGEGGEAGGVGAHEPVAAFPRQAVHLGGDPDLA